MRLVVLGTGTVGRALAAAFSTAGHDVVLATREVPVTLARPEVADWVAAHPGVPVVPTAAAAHEAEVVVNATNGAVSVDALRRLGDLAGVVVLDVANPLDFSAGFPPTLTVANTDSLAEQVQRAFPDARVVKTLNTVTAAVMVDPGSLPGEHHVFVAGEDPEAKALATRLLGDLGWPPGSVLDLGGIRTARATEMYLPLWLALMAATGGPVFNIRLVRP